MYTTIINSPLGNLGIQVADGALINIDFLPAAAALRAAADPVTLTIISQLENYFCNPNNPFTVPLKLNGTVFQQRVWQALMDIPLGTTRTYGEIARQLNTSPRSIGNACRRNPIPIIVPCHRVVALQSMGGYSGEINGAMMAIKRWLLQHEAS